jgi:hypothetical protein
MRIVHLLLAVAAAGSISWAQDAAAEEETRVKVPKNLTVDPFGGSRQWVMTGSCETAMRIYKEREMPGAFERIKKLDPRLWDGYNDNTSVAVIERRRGCSRVQSWTTAAAGWVASELVVLSTEDAAYFKKLDDARAELARRGKALQDALAKTPTVVNDMALMFFGADRKCAEEYSAALSMDGLAKRKKLAELVAFGCGFTEKQNMHVLQVGKEQGFCLVRLVEGDHYDKQGWVQCGWIKAPAVSGSAGTPANRPAVPPKKI